MDAVTTFFVASPVIALTAYIVVSAIAEYVKLRKVQESNRRNKL